MLSRGRTWHSTITACMSSEASRASGSSTPYDSRNQTSCTRGAADLHHVRRSMVSKPRCRRGDSRLDPTRATRPRGVAGRLRSWRSPTIRAALALSTSVEYERGPKPIRREHRQMEVTRRGEMSASQPAALFLPSVATKLTQSPWFLNRALRPGVMIEAARSACGYCAGRVVCSAKTQLGPLSGGRIRVKQLA